MMERKYTLILTSKGFESEEGTNIIRIALEKTGRTVLKSLNILLVTIEEYGADERMYNNCKSLGFKNVYLSKDYEERLISEGRDCMPHIDMVFVTQGNTFEVVEYMVKYGFFQYIREIIYDGGIYIGASAGAIISGKDFGLAEKFDINYPEISDYTALELMPEKDTIIPHYTFEDNKRFVQSLDNKTKAKYTRIYNVANDEAIIMTCIKANGNVELVNRKRIRV